MKNCLTKVQHQADSCAAWAAGCAARMAGSSSTRGIDRGEKSLRRNRANTVNQCSAGIAAENFALVRDKIEPKIDKIGRSPSRRSQA